MSLPISTASEATGVSSLTTAASSIPQSSSSTTPQLQSNGDEPAYKKHRPASKYPDNNRVISLFSISSRHPLNVKPGGNSLLSSGDFKPSKYDQMGHFAQFPEELLMDLFHFVDDVHALLQLSHTSRVMYAYLYDEDIWRKLHTRRVLRSDDQNEASLQWKGSWRCTMLQIEELQQANIQQTPENLLCSDALYRPFQCSQVDYHRVFHKTISEELIYHQDSIKGQFDYHNLPSGRIPRINEDDLTLDEFNQAWSNKPFILTNSSQNRWPTWQLEELLGRFPQVTFRQELVQWPLKLYCQYLNNNKDENPLYLFDCHSAAMKTLRQEYTPPKIFQPDYFKSFNHFSNAQCRPDYAWLIVGPQRSGSTFHKDPNSTSAWNTAIQGRKLWVMLPPGITPPGVGTDEEESEVTSPVGIAEWVMSGFFNDALKIEECQVGITFPGECLYVPSGWWHTVINLDDSIALTQNFVPLGQLPQVLNFFKHKQAQISGFKPKNVKLAMDRVLAEGGDDNDDSLNKLKEYSNIFETLDQRLQDEDCGEITTTKLPPMPIFELFSKLMTLSGDQSELDVGLEKLSKLERVDKMNKTGKSEMWNKLTAHPIEEENDQEIPETNGGFSFAFAFDESSDEEE